MKKRGAQKQDITTHSFSHIWSVAPPTGQTHFRYISGSVRKS
jgi:hypothetical protein